MSRRALALSAAAAAAAVAVMTAAAVILLSSGGGDETPEPQAVPAASAHQNLVRGTVWVANEEGAVLTAIAAGSNEVVATLTGVEGAHNIQVAPDGRTVWAVSGHDSLAAMIDATTYERHRTVTTGGEHGHLAATP